MKPNEPVVNSFESWLDEELKAIHDLALHRTLRTIESPQSKRIRIAGTEMVNFSSNDYLGLTTHPAVKEAAVRAVEKFGCGSGASRLICGSLSPHADLEHAIASFKNAPAAICFSSGYAAAVGAICALVGKNDVIIIDRLVHACIVDAARLSGAKLRVFAHNDLNDLEEILRWADRRADHKQAGERGRILVVSESVFSMDGDLAPLRELVELKARHGALLMIDEAHGTGIFGRHRRGLVDKHGLTEQVEVQMGTLGKALGSSGGFVCGSSRLIDLLVNRARTFIYSTAPVPAASAAACAAIEVVQSNEGAARCGQLWSNLTLLKTRMEVLLKRDNPVASPIIPILFGPEDAASQAAKALQEAGVFIPAIRFPSVGRGEARLRLTLTAAHTEEDLDKLVSALAEVMRNSSGKTHNA